MNRAKAKQDIAIGIVFYALSAFVLYQTANLRQPDSKIFPYMIVSMILLLTTILFVRAVIAFFITTEKPREKQSAGKLKKEVLIPCIAFVGIFIYTLLFDFTNYFIASAVLIAAFLLINKVRPLWLIAVITAGYLLFAYVLFVQLLNVRLI